MKTKFDEFIDESIAQCYRGVDIDDAISWCNGIPIPSYEPIPLDWEVVEYGLGDDAKDMTEDEVEEWVKSVCDWYDGSVESVQGGLNVTTDFENAKGYDDYVLGINPTGNFAEFSDSHWFLEDCKDSELMFVYDNQSDKFYKPQEFLFKKTTKKFNL